MPNTPVRAAAEGMPAISRRYFLANTVAAAAVTAVVAAPVAVEAAGNPDVELFALLAKFEEANAEMKRLGKIHDHFENTFYDGKPKEPKCPEHPPIDLDMTLRQLQQRPPIYKAFEAERAEWQAACEKFKVDCGYVEADENYRNALDVASDFVQQIIETPAYTPQGMLVKIRLAGEWGEWDECLEYLEADIRHLAGEQVS